jgi:EpsI family protein
VAINKLIKAERKRERLVLFWYDLNGRIVTDRYKAKMYTAWDALMKGRTNGAVIMVSSDFEGAEDPHQIPKETEQFMQKVIPLSREFLP